MNQVASQTAWKNALDEERKIQKMEETAKLKMESLTREQQDSMF